MTVRLDFTKTEDRHRGLGPLGYCQKREIESLYPYYHRKTMTLQTQRNNSKQTEESWREIILRRIDLTDNNRTNYAIGTKIRLDTFSICNQHCRFWVGTEEGH